jgi:hypothetical protein
MFCEEKSLFLWIYGGHQAMFCFVCYLFKDNIHAGGDTFVIGGF